MVTFLIIVVVYIWSTIIAQSATDYARKQSDNPILHHSATNFSAFIPVANTFIAILYIRRQLLNKLKK